MDLRTRRGRGVRWPAVSARVPPLGTGSGEVGARRGRAGAPRPGAHDARWADNGRTATRTYMISNPRAGRRLGEKRLLAASRGPWAAYLAAVSSSPAAAPSRASTAPRPTQSGPPSHQGGPGRASRAARACQPVRKCPGTSRRPPLPASRVAAAGSRQAPGRCSPLSAGLPRPGSCRLLRLLLLPAETGEEESGAAAPLRRPGGRAQHVPAAGVGRLRGRAPRRGPGARAAAAGYKERPARDAVEYKLINTTPNRRAPDHQSSCSKFVQLGRL